MSEEDEEAVRARLIASGRLIIPRPPEPERVDFYVKMWRDTIRNARIMQFVIVLGSFALIALTLKQAAEVRAFASVAVLVAMTFMARTGYVIAEAEASIEGRRKELGS